MRVVPWLVLLCLSVCAPAALAETRSGAYDDPAGDSAAGQPDLTNLQVALDPEGTLDARLTFAAAPDPSSDAVAVVVFGRTSGDTCSPRVSIAAKVVGPGDAYWTQDDDSAEGSGTAARDGATLTLHAADPRAASTADCVFAGLQGAVSGQTYDVIANRALTIPEPPPPPPSTTTTPTTTTPVPPAEPVPPAPKATPLERYDAAVAKCPKRPAKTRARCLARARTSNPAGARMAVKRRSNPFLGKVFMTTDVDVAGVCGGVCITAWVISNDRFAHRGLPDDGPVLARCTKVTAVGDKDGCLTYRLARNHRSIDVGGVTLRLAKGGRQISEDDHKGDGTRTLTQVAIPAVGSRYDADMDTISSFGIAGVNQSFFTGQLTLARDGRFVTAGQASGTTGQGTSLEATYAALGADRKGTYAFEPGGTLALTYADGRVTRRSAVVAFGEKDRPGTVSKDGLFLNGAYYQVDDGT